MTDRELAEALLKIDAEMKKQNIEEALRILKQLIHKGEQ